MTDYAFILSELYPEAKWSMNGDDYKNIQWLEGTKAISKSKLDADYVAYKAANDYKKHRAAEYPSIEEVVVALREAVGENKPQALQLVMAKVFEVKAKYPKPDVNS